MSGPMVETRERPLSLSYRRPADRSERAVLEQAVDGLGVEAYRWDQLITLDPGYVQQRRLLARSELLSTVVIKLADGGYVALTLSIPDTQKEWWPRLDAVIASLAVL